MMGRYILPWFGGGPAVWTACLLFFQTFLLAGYAYAHWLGSLSNVRWQVRVHVTLLAASLLLLPIAPRADLWKSVADGDPLARILLLLTVTVGGPYLLLSATAPLLQRWFTLSASSQSPWRLYALSNFGSFLALLGYPFAIEPFLRLRTQGWIWSGGYVLFVAACIWTAALVRPALSASTGGDASPRPNITTVLFWLGLSTCGSVLLVATTNQISEDIAVSPFLWVAALAIYLLTFVLAFESDRFYRRTAFAVAAGIAAPVACMLPAASVSLSLRLQLVLYLAAQFIVCMLCHGELARSRPRPRYLTQFYLTIAAGGALGGVFVALIAPRIFTEFSEYQIGLAGACLLGFVGWLRSGALAEWTRSNLAVRLPLMALLIGGLTAIVATTTSGKLGAVASARNFYGILRVMERFDDNGAFRELQHGRTRHGMEYLAPQQRDWPTTYYGPHSGIAIALNAVDKPARSIAVVGLGTGTLADLGPYRRYVPLLRNQSGCRTDRARLVLVLTRFESANPRRARRCARATRQRTRPRTIARFRFDRRRRFFKRLDSDASADRRMRRPLPAAPRARRRTGAAHFQSRSESRSGSARRGSASRLDCGPDQSPPTMPQPVRAVRIGF